MNYPGRHPEALRARAAALRTSADLLGSDESRMSCYPAGWHRDLAKLLEDAAEWIEYLDGMLDSLENF